MNNTTPPTAPTTHPTLDDLRHTRTTLYRRLEFPPYPCAPDELAHIRKRNEVRRTLIGAIDRLITLRLTERTQSYGFEFDR